MVRRLWCYGYFRMYGRDCRVASLLAMTSLVVCVAVVKKEYLKLKGIEAGLSEQKKPLSGNYIELASKSRSISLFLKKMGFCLTIR